MGKVWYCTTVVHGKGLGASMIHGRGYETDAVLNESVLRFGTRKGRGATAGNGGGGMLQVWYTGAVW